MKFAEKIYSLSPVFIQNILCSLKGLQVCRSRYNNNFHRQLQAYESQSYRQEDCLKQFITCISRDVPYYSKLFHSVGFNMEADNIYAEIKKLPIIDKTFVKEHFNDLINTKYKLPYGEMRTSGTTGSGLIFPYSVDMENRQWAVWWRYRRELGIDFSMWCGWFGGKQIISTKTNKAPYWRINQPGRQIMFSSYHLTEETVCDYYKKIVKSNLFWLHGYPSHIARLAALLDKAGFPPLKNVKIITTGAENLLGNQKEIIARSFPEAIIRQHYGLNEGVANISQNKEGEWIVDDDFCYVEFIPVSSASPTICRIVGTGFSNHVFPLVRYDTGDLATIEYQKDGAIKVISIDGRSNNVIRQPRGNDICEARLSIFLHDFMNISEAQFHQLSMTSIELLIVKGKNFNEEDEKQIRKSFTNWFDEKMEFTIRYVDKIPRTKSGKLRIVTSDIGNQ